MDLRRGGQKGLCDPIGATEPRLAPISIIIGSVESPRPRTLALCFFGMCARTPLAQNFSNAKTSCIFLRRGRRQSLGRAHGGVSRSNEFRDSGSVPPFDELLKLDEPFVDRFHLGS